MDVIRNANSRWAFVLEPGLLKIQGELIPLTPFALQQTIWFNQEFDAYFTHAAVNKCNYMSRWLSVHSPPEAWIQNQENEMTNLKDTTCKTSPTCATPSVHKLLLYIRCWLQFHRLSSSPQVVEPSAAFSWPRFGGMASFAIATLFLQLQAKNHHACSRPKLVCQLLHVQPRPTCHQDLWNLQMDHASACHRSRRHQEQVGKHCRTWNTCRECNTKLGQGTRVDGVITIRCIAILFAIDVHSLKQTCACMCQKKGMAMVWHSCKNM